jgi:hypothetical protein
VILRRPTAPRAARLSGAVVTKQIVHVKVTTGSLQSEPDDRLTRREPPGPTGNVHRRDHHDLADREYPVTRMDYHTLSMTRAPTHARLRPVRVRSASVLCLNAVGGPFKLS